MVRCIFDYVLAGIDMTLSFLLRLDFDARRMIKQDI